MLTTNQIIILPSNNTILKRNIKQKKLLNILRSFVHFSDRESSRYFRINTIKGDRKIIILENIVVSTIYI